MLVAWVVQVFLVSGAELILQYDHIVKLYNNILVNKISLVKNYIFVINH